MQEPLLTICIVNYNSSDFIELMLHALEKLTYHPYRVIIRDNNSKEEDYRTMQQIAARYANVELYQVKTELFGSLGHGDALNEMVGRIQTPYGVIMDADALFLIRDWDRLLIARMKAENVTIYGTQAGKRGGKPLDFPMIFAVIFDTEVMKRMHVDFRPKDREINRFQDTGWEMRKRYLLESHLCGGLLYNFNTRSYNQGPFARVICSEFYFSPDASGSIVASHFGRGSAPRAKNLIRINLFRRTLAVRAINRVLQYFNVAKWRYDKRRWISIAKHIVDSQ